MQCLRHGLVDDLEHAAAGQKFVLRQRDVWLDAGCVAVHHKRDRSGRGQHGDLRIAESAFFSRRFGSLPAILRFLFQSVERACLNGFHRIPMPTHYGLHGVCIARGDGMIDAGALGVPPTLERTHHRGDGGGLGVCLAGHNRREGAGQRAGFLRIIRQAVTHNQRAQVGVAQSQSAKNVGVFGNGGRGIAGVIHQNFLGGDKNAHRSFESLRVKTTGARELHQVQGSQVAGSIVEEDVFGAWVGGVDRRSSLASMPMLDGRVELKAGIAA